MRKKEVAFSRNVVRMARVAIPHEPAQSGYQVALEGDKHEVPDALLISAAKAGSRVAFEELSRCYSKRLQCQIYRILHNWEDSKDALQDALFKAFRYMAQFRSDCTLSTWLTRIGINSALSILRKRRRCASVSYDSAGDSTEKLGFQQFPDCSQNPELSCAYREVEELLRVAMLKLPWSYRSVIELFHNEMCSINEVAETLHTSVAAVKSRLKRARKAPRKSLPELHKPDARRLSTVLICAVTLFGFLAVSNHASSQIGSGAPDASSRVQVQVQDTSRRADLAPPQTETFAGQALDQDVAVLARLPADPLFKRDPFRPVLGPADAAMNDLRRAERLSFAATYTVLNQYATATPDGVRHNWATGRLDLSGGWKAYDRGGNTGSFSMLVRSGVNLGVSQSFNLSDNIGSGLVLDCLPGGGPQEPITLNVLYYRQDFYRKKIAFYIGKIHPNEFISLSLYNNDERSQFLNAENDGNLTIPSDGTYAGGAALEYQITPHIYIHAVTVDTEGAQQRNLETLADKKYMNAIELGWKTGAPTQQEHLFRFLLWRDDTATQGSGAGLGFGSDYELRDGWVPFGRLGIGTDTGASIKRVFDAGLVNIRPFGRRGDMFGASINITDPSHAAKHHETLFETFYRVRLTQSLELGPDLEVSVHPTNSVRQYTTALLGLRMKIIF